MEAAGERARATIEIALLLDLGRRELSTIRGFAVTRYRRRISRQAYVVAPSRLALAKLSNS